MTSHVYAVCMLIDILLVFMYVYIYLYIHGYECKNIVMQTDIHEYVCTYAYTYTYIYIT